VSDLLKALTGGPWSFLVSWVLPCAIGISALLILVLPVLDAPARPAATASAPSPAVPPPPRPPATLAPGAPTEGPAETVTIAVVVGFLALALGIVMSAMSVPLYRLLEGYSWPRALQDLGVNRHLRRKSRLEELAAKETGWRQALIREQLHRYPHDDTHVAPTRFGNALRAFETYGSDRYGLDSQILWSELSASVPEALQKGLEEARAQVDFCVCSLYVSTVVGLIAVASSLPFLYRGQLGLETIRLLVVGVLGLGAAALWYRIAITCSGYWHSTVRALVNLGRGELAKSLGLRLPPTLRQERALWNAVSIFVYYGYYEEQVGVWDSWRERESPRGSEAGTCPQDRG